MLVKIIVMTGAHRAGRNLTLTRLNADWQEKMARNGNIQLVSSDLVINCLSEKLLAYI